ncbi:Adenylate-forming Reductase [Pleurotus pulmonarius]
MSLLSHPRLDFDTLPYPPVPKTQALSSLTFKPPPLDGSLTIPEFYDWHYHNSPEHPVLIFPEEDGSQRTIKWAETTQAIHTCARILQRTISAEQGAETIVGIFAASDTITYFTLIAATFRAGFAPFVISARNSPAAVAHLLSTTRAKHVIVGSDAALLDALGTALNLMQEKNPSIVLPGRSMMPTFEEIFVSDAAFELLPPCRPNANSLALIFHSSGSTAFPKPIGWSHRQLLQLAVVPYFGERDLTGVKLSCHAMPMYHGMGASQTLWTATMGIIVTAARPQTPPVPATPENVLISAQATAADIIFCVPSFIEAWSRNIATIEYLKSIDGVFFGGGPLNKKAGDLVARNGVSIYILYGSSEIGIPAPILPHNPGLDWEYFTLTKQYKGTYMPNGFGQYELVILPNPYQIPSVINGQLDGQDAYYTSDLFVAHPIKPGYYKVFGRADDQLMHNTGEKTNPGPLENILNQDPRVQTSVMFGRGRFNVGVIVDPRPEYRFDPSDAANLAEFRNAIWPTVERMNNYAPQHSRLFKEMILVVSPSKPFDYTSKSTARRQTIINNYEPEIEALYQSVAETSQVDVELPAAWSMEETLPFVRKLVHQVLGSTSSNLGDDDDLFQHGSDSLQATWIRNTLLRAIRDSTRLSTNGVAENIVYQHPSVNKLTSFAVRLASRGMVVASTSEDGKLAAENMQEMVDRFSQGFSEGALNGNGQASEVGGDVYLVAGTTGSLGAALLADLLRNPKIRQIYALNRYNRTTSLQARQEEAFQTIGLPLDLLAQRTRLILIETDLADDNAGLTSTLVEQIRVSVTHIIINAWPVDFNLSLPSFEPSVKAVRNLIDLALSSYRPQPPAVTFVSSIGVLSRRKDKTSASEVPATVDEAAGTGYSQAKWVAETILQRVASRTSMKVAIVRVGQLSGARNGHWKPSDWLPTIVKSSRSLGHFPDFDDDKVISWIPLEAACQVLLELASDPSEGSNIFHLVHPTPVQANLVSRALSSLLKIPLIPYIEWLDLLETRAQEVSTMGASSHDLQEIPALKMPHFFRTMKVGWEQNGSGREAWGLPSLDFTKAFEASSTMRQDVQPIDEQEVKRWIGYWGLRGFL